jgi:hypothetical protein
VHRCSLLPGASALDGDGSNGGKTNASAGPDKR